MEKKNIKFIELEKYIENNDCFSLGSFSDSIKNSVHNCELNKIDPYKVPIIIQNQSSNDDYILNSISTGFTDNSFRVKLMFWDNQNIDYFNGKDERPKEVGAEYWQSRGESHYDVSGFVKSKEAGERLLRLVHWILEKDETETYLDWRKYEPNWIQFKFSAKEFDCKKLSDMSIEAGGILNEKIIRACVKQN